MTCAQELNAHGVARMCRLLAVLQPSLSALGAPGGAFRPEAARAFDKARAYYNLLALPPPALLRVASERPGRFFPAEYQALLQARGRRVTANFGFYLRGSASSGLLHVATGG